jgi:hypothetical protein
MDEITNDLNITLSIRRRDGERPKPSDIVRGLLQLAESWTLEEQSGETLNVLFVENESVSFRLVINDVAIFGDMLSDQAVLNKKRESEHGQNGNGNGAPHREITSQVVSPSVIPINIQEILERMANAFNDDNQDSDGDSDEDNDN